MSVYLLNRICYIFLSLVNVPECMSEKKIQICKYLVWRRKAGMIQQTFEFENQSIVYIGLRFPNPEQQVGVKRRSVQAECVWKGHIILIHFPMKQTCNDWMENLTPDSWEAGPDKIMQVAEGVPEMVAVFLGWAFSHQSLQAKPIP